jgi:cell wall-associated NlpC family hydrolase
MRPGSVAAKQAQAQQVLSQINRIDESLGAAVEQYNLANVALHKIEGDLRENKKQLALARANLKISQKSLARGSSRVHVDGGQLDARGAARLDELRGLLNRVEAINSTSTRTRTSSAGRSSKLAIQRNQSELRNAHSEQQRIVAQKAAQRQHIESQLAARRQLLSSIRGEIQRIKAAEAAQQRQLAAAAQARIAGQSRPTVSGVGVGASTPEGSTVAPPNVHGGVVGIAMHYLGVPYVWGGSSPRGFDCSGLVMYVFAQIGVSLPHSSYSQAGMGTPVSINQLEPGDLVFFTGASHVGIYIGGGQFIHAPHTGTSSRSRR